MPTPYQEAQAQIMENKLRATLAGDSLTFGGLQEGMSVSEATLRKYLDRMIKRGEVKEDRSGRAFLYSLTKRGAKQVGNKQAATTTPQEVSMEALVQAADALDAPTSTTVAGTVTQLTLATGNLPTTDEIEQFFAKVVQRLRRGEEREARLLHAVQEIIGTP